VTVELRSTRWKCRNEQCSRKTFVGKLVSALSIAIDDWSWRKGFAYGTIIVDLERRTVADVLESRSAKATADWLKRYPGIEVVSRDRCGLYAQGIREGAPHARQVADRFHLLQNLRENIERELTSVSRHAGRSRLPPATARNACAASAISHVRLCLSGPNRCMPQVRPSSTSPQKSE
jgi:transposase